MGCHSADRLFIASSQRGSNDELSLWILDKWYNLNTLASFHQSSVKLKYVG